MESASKNGQYKDYSLSPVPLSERRDLYSLMTVYGGYGMSVFNLIVGGILGSSMTFGNALLVIIFGNIVLVIIGSFTGFIGLKFGLSTTMLSRSTFGVKGQVLTSFLIALTVPGFVGLYTSTIGQMLHSLFPVIPWLVGSVFFLGCIVLTSIYGFKGLAVLSHFAVPAVIILSIYGINKMGGLGKIFTFTPESAMPMIEAFSMVVATWVVGAVIAGGDVGRYAKTKTDIVVSNCFGWLLAAGGVEVIGAASAAAANKGNIAEIMISMGLIVPGLLLYYLLMWTTADNNLYAFSLAFMSIQQAVSPNSKKKKTFWVLVGACCILAVGVIATLIGSSAFVYKLLGYVGSYAPAYGAVFIADFFVIGRIKQTGEQLKQTRPIVNWRALIAVACGYVAGSLPFGIQVLQSFIVAFVVYVIACNLAK